MIANRDSLTINGQELLTEDRANPEDNIIAMFHYDANQDGIEGDDPSQFSAFPFMAATDNVFSTSNESVEVSFNGKAIRAPSIAEGASIVIH